MATITAPHKSRSMAEVLLKKWPGTVKKALDETAGIWRGRKLDPINYQRAMRKQYSTLNRGKRNDN